MEGFLQDPEGNCVGEWWGRLPQMPLEGVMAGGLWGARD